MPLIYYIARCYSSNHCHNRKSMAKSEAKRSEEAFSSYCDKTVFCLLSSNQTHLPGLVLGGGDAVCPSLNRRTLISNANLPRCCCCCSHYRPSRHEAVGAHLSYGSWEVREVLYSCLTMARENGAVCVSYYLSCRRRRRLLLRIPLPLLPLDIFAMSRIRRRNSHRPVRRNMCQYR